MTKLVSIHAPHAGRDQDFKCNLEAEQVSIHAPHAGRDESNVRLDS